MWLGMCRNDIKRYFIESSKIPVSIARSKKQLLGYDIS